MKEEWWGRGDTDFKVTSNELNTTTRTKWGEKRKLKLTFIIVCFVSEPNFITSCVFTLYSTPGHINSTIFFRS